MVPSIAMLVGVALGSQAPTQHALLHDTFCCALIAPLQQMVDDKLKRTEQLHALARQAINRTKSIDAHLATCNATNDRLQASLASLNTTTLALRGEAEAASVAGRREAARFTECRRHLEPLFAQLQARTTPVELLSAFEEIVEHMRRREYVAAHDAYIRCAIGNAPWPMGVGVTGLHEGRGRQGVRDTKIAHVMNDETQRKYLQGVKRLLTYAQQVLPADAPSQMVG